MVPEFPRDVFVYNSHLIGRIGVECLLERVAGWCAFFAWRKGQCHVSVTDNIVQHSTVFNAGFWTVRARCRAIF